MYKQLEFSFMDQLDIKMETVSYLYEYGVTIVSTEIQENAI